MSCPATFSVPAATVADEVMPASARSASLPDSASQVPLRQRVSRPRTCWARIGPAAATRQQRQEQKGRRPAWPPCGHGVKRRSWRVPDSRFKLLDI